MNKCKDCDHFKKHYMKNRGGFIYASCGHCTINRNGQLKENCKKFCIRMQKEQNADREVTKQYLKMAFNEILIRLENIEGFLKNL